jgi:hypothetical protein
VGEDRPFHLPHTEGRRLGAMWRELLNIETVTPLGRGSVNQGLAPLCKYLRRLDGIFFL